MGRRAGSRFFDPAGGGVPTTRMEARAAFLEEMQRERRVWGKKPFLRAVYQNEFYPLVLRHRAEGTRTLEVGGGPGFFKEFAPGVVSSDIVACGWHDLAADAQRLPFPDRILDNVVGIDFLHHLNDPMRFLAETGRVLRPGGRLVMIEPWETPLSHLVNTFFMDEDWDLSWRPGDLCRPATKAPMEANGAVPYLLFGRRRSSLPRLLPALRLVRLEPFGFLGYLLSLGFRETSLLSPAWYPCVHAVETATRPIWQGLAALKALIVLERT